MRIVDHQNLGRSAVKSLGKYRGVSRYLESDGRTCARQVAGSTPSYSAWRKCRTSCCSKWGSSVGFFCLTIGSLVESTTGALEIVDNSCTEAPSDGFSDVLARLLWQVLPLPQSSRSNTTGQNATVHQMSHWPSPMCHRLGLCTHLQARWPVKGYPIYV